MSIKKKSTFLLISFFTFLAAFFGSPLISWITGEISLYAYALILPFLIGWLISRLSYKEIGYQKSKLRWYKIGVLPALVVLSLISILMLLFGIGKIDTSVIPAWKVILGIFIDIPILALTLLLTEEAFFRGFLWALFKKEGWLLNRRVFFTSFLFTLWHVPVLFLFSGEQMSIGIIFIYLLNAIIGGIFWGYLREASNSIVVTSFSHALWNFSNYVLFGYYGGGGGIITVPTSQVIWFDPERGMLGLLFNFLLTLMVFKHLKKSKSLIGS